MSSERKIRLEMGPFVVGMVGIHSGYQDEFRKASGTCCLVLVTLGCVQTCFQVPFICSWIRRLGSPVRKASANVRSSCPRVPTPAFVGPAVNSYPSFDWVILIGTGGPKWGADIDVLLGSRQNDFLGPKGCWEWVARRGKHLHRLAAHYGKLSRGIPVPPLSRFFPALPQVIGGTFDIPSTEYDDSSSDTAKALFALPAVYAITEETSPRVHIRIAQEDEELANWTSVPCYSAMVANVRPLPIYFGEGLDEDGRVPEIEQSLHRLENHQLTSVEPTEEINIGTAEEPCTLRIGTGLDPTQKARMIDFLLEY
ncbi:hypothetical protein CRG98_018859 [Punica granatum]|uniref:Uncharacterized protein n=1 Tax=Punica granatum TaxID=22663 RepID=A0A2I0JWN9_PUNGR|nr:hypothetical protein CRG98_018859 [Punica granatum]